MRDAVDEPWNWRREKTVLEKGMRKPRTPRRVGFPGYRLVMRSVKGNGGIIPSLLARSPFAAEGWKKRRSYWSALSDIVT